MTGPANKRQKREEYRKTQFAAQNGGKLALPKKKFYRQRAHANPFSDHNLKYPTCPEEMDWSIHYPAFFPSAKSSNPADEPSNRPVLDTSTPSRPENQSAQLTPTAPHPTIADVGCGFGGLLIALAPLFPNSLILGLELRHQVLSYVHSRITALRSQNPLRPQPESSSSPQTETPTNGTAPEANPMTTTHYANISALRTNTMKFLPQLLPRASLTHLFLCFPDPHFKARKHKARIVSAQLNAEYAYFLKPGVGKIYTITDVEELHGWIVRHFEGHEAGEVKELFERVGEEELEGDECVRVMREETEEGKKVTRNGGRKFVGVWRRKKDPDWEDE
ncbi:tRNA (guanine-N(7)-)-methyltransferase [Cyphellophora attinorum]|uniref:tRNA (guanine-N(7)-)-methyltransferase n=1 Tax=Cyphellophora attinorum TaxID=1664694 RepID=A0A0N1P3R9_9EURO|nr:tRNA (guanine-N(7)-)-methyltransferase [Phialophora attinorum]KPI46030.1 tRNA (guanine-N(7)-)-methyltransferase [Phialophora attinorum]